MELTQEYQALLASIGEAQQEIAAGQQLLRLIQRFQVQTGGSPHTNVSEQQTGSGWMLESPGQRVQLPPDGALLIGRQEGCELRLEDRKASRQHARIEQRAGRYWVVDLGSSNGVYVNGQRISGEQRLANGDQLLIGDTRLSVVELRVDGSGDRTVLTNMGRDASVKSRDSAIPAGEQSPVESRVCSKCGQSLSAAERYCPDCGAAIT